MSVNSTTSGGNEHNDNDILRFKSVQTCSKEHFICKLNPAAVEAQYASHTQTTLPNA